MAAQIAKVVTSGTFSLDGQDFAVDNNVWLIGDDHEVIVIDAAHDPDAILAAVGGRRLSAIVCTHGHNDHINAAPQVAEATGAPILMHPADQVLWRMVYPDTVPDGDLADEEVIEIAATPLRVLHTPGHSPGSVCLYAPALRAVFSGRHPVPRRPRRDGPVVFGPRRDHQVHPGPAGGPAAGDRRAHRARRGHHDRRRGRPVRPLKAGTVKAAR